ncbi:MAG: hypothetical protein WCF33_01415 [Pseudonocardiaceae bacterium]
MHPRSGGSWPFAFGDVQAKATPEQAEHRTPYVTCTTNPAGDRHVWANA